MKVFNLSIFIVVLLLQVSCVSTQKNDYKLIPEPFSLKAASGQFVFDEQTLRQLLPAAIENKTKQNQIQWSVPRRWDSTRGGGYYTQQDIKEVIDYAQKRFVNILPEIEMPGHALAALTAYPQYSCTGDPFSVEGSWGIFDDVYCTREETFGFLEDILVEVAGMWT
jgi:hypothetical protein